MKNANNFLFFMQNFYGGGAEKVIVNLSNQLHLGGNKVTLLVNKEVGPYRERLNKDVTVISLDRSRLIYSLFSVRGIIDELEPDYFISTLDMPNIITGILALLNRFKRSNKCKYIAREANTVSSYNLQTTPSSYLKMQVRKLIYGNIDLVIANSPDTRNEIIETLRVPSNKVVAIGNPVLDDTDIKVPVYHNRHINDKYKIIYVGRLEYQKNLYLLVDVIKVLSESHKVELDLYGTGSLESELQSYVVKKGLQNSIKFMGFRNDVVDLYSAYDAFVLTSFWEGFGNVFVEALATGIPVITTRSKGGASYIINDTDIGTLCSFDAIEIANAIVSEITSNSLEKVSARIERASFFTSKKVAIRYKEACNEVL